jgi:hypothetical protein
MIIESRRTDSAVDGSKRDPAPASCVCGHLGRFRLDLTRTRASGGRPASARCETCGGWQSMSTILCYAALKERGQRQSINRFLAVGALVLAGLVATTLASQALEYLGTPIDPAPHAHSRSA